MRTPWSLVCALVATVALGSAQAEAQDSLGLNTHVPATDLLNLCTDLGVEWIRVDGNWLDMNPGPGRFDFATMDRVVDDARARGLRVYMTLAYTPAWVPRVARARTDTYPGNDEPMTSAEWTTFVTAAVTHFRPRGVTHFGLWNEPNLDGFWESPAGIDTYIDKIVLPGAMAVRRACTDCRVLGPDLAHVGAYDTALDRILERAASAFDILTHHIYQGFVETGVTALSGDNFLQALEHRRFPFTRAALREVLDARGFSREVWITETGLRARVGDGADETRQGTYVRRVMEEQLSRGWWSNTFFYEITDCGVDQPTCDIDGFGITRPLRAVSAGPRAWPADYRRKPAYDAIRAFVTAHPEIVSRPTAAQCANGRDDDGDSRIDAADRGCRDGADNNESDDPPRRSLDAPAAPAGGITLDGNLREWADGPWVALTRADWAGGGAYGGPSDLGVRVAARWSPEALYVAAEVTDDVHVNDRPDDALWMADSVQLAFDLARNYGDRYDSTDDHELTFGLSMGAARAFRFTGPAGSAPPPSPAIRRDGTTTRYELALPAASLRPATYRVGTTFGWTFLVNDNDGATTLDGSGREGWMEFTPGIGARKDPYSFGELRLVATAVAPDASVPPDASVAPDASASADASPATDISPLADTSAAPQDTAPGCACTAHRTPPARTGNTFATLSLLCLAASVRRRSAVVRVAPRRA